MDVEAVGCRRRIARRELAVEGQLVLDQADRDATVAGIASRRLGIETSGIDDVLEQHLAAVADRNPRAAGDLHLALALVAHVAVGAVLVAHERLHRALGPGKQVFATRVAAVEQVQQLVLALAQLAGQRLLVVGVQCAVAGLAGDLADALEDVADRTEDGFLLAQAVLRLGHAGLVLLVQPLFLVQAQQAYRTDRVVRRGQDALAGADLLEGTVQVRVVAGNPVDRVVEGLDGGNAHGGGLAGLGPVERTQRNAPIRVSNRVRAT
ncbi:hypothetical protein NCGM2_1950 [Pseudomonas aeruginosa NCGM2.S1]|nr:hypothetical protein NCGM2_1950 [Pseudomonas aeruginosa NCGM2.S1]